MLTKEKYLIFLDIDGTLVDFGSTIPQSAVRAIKLAQQNGHEVFICSGRTRALVPSYLVDFGFDGIVSSTGSHIEYHGKVALSAAMPDRLYYKMLDSVDYKKTAIIVCAHSGCIVRKSDADRLADEWSIASDLTKDRTKALIESLQPIYFDEDIYTCPERYDDIVAINYINCGNTVEELREIVGSELNVTIAAFTKPNPYCGEVTYGKYDKATGIDFMCKKTGVDLAHTIAIGDAGNDECMIKHAGIGVAMGNAIPLIKDVADYITTDVNDNGIANAFVHLGLIE